MGMNLSWPCQQINITSIRCSAVIQVYWTSSCKVYLPSNIDNNPTVTHCVFLEKKKTVQKYIDMYCIIIYHPANWQFFCVLKE